MIQKYLILISMLVKKIELRHVSEIESVFRKLIPTFFIERVNHKVSKWHKKSLKRNTILSSKIKTMNRYGKIRFILLLKELVLRYSNPCYKYQNEILTQLIHIRKIAWCARRSYDEFSIAWIFVVNTSVKRYHR